MEKIAITMGDANGVGPEIILKALMHIADVSNIVLIGNKEVFNYNEKITNTKLPSNLEFINVEYDNPPIQYNNIDDKSCGELAYKCLKKACELIQDGYIAKIATAPLSKNALHLAGYNYSGQTEILQKELAFDNEKAQMLFVTEKLRILLLTRHIALKDIPSFITKENIASNIKILNNELKKQFAIKSPKIAMCALNPHSGENGILGREEIDIINPVIKELKQNNINIFGAYSSDTLLGKAIQNYKNPDFDAYIACYHDQALPAIKSLGLDKVLNITIGLRALRVSPAHGTAFDIAYQNKADYKGMLNSILFLQNKSCI